jgi:ABC-type dipeptide/oligopeptide/nickel transport system permease subunit
VSNVVVRQAMELAISRNDIVKAGYDGAGIPQDQPYNLKSVWYQNRKARLDGDLAGAKAKLSSSGVNIADMTIKILQYQSFTLKEAQVVQSAWKQLGFKDVTIDTIDSTQIIERLGKGDWDAVLANASGVFVPDRVYNYYDPAQGWRNALAGNINDPRVLSLLVKAKSTTDIAARKGYYQQIDDIGNKELCTCFWTMQPVRYVAMTSSVKNWDPSRWPRRRLLVEIAMAPPRGGAPVEALMALNWLHHLRRFYRSPLTVAGVALVLFWVLAAAGASLITSYDPNLIVARDRLLDNGVGGHVLGTDSFGRDVLTRLIYGARLSLFVGALVAFGALVLGGLLGALGGYFGGTLDTVTSRFIDGLISFPGLLLALVLAGLIGPGTNTAIIGLTVAFAPVAGRVMRSAVLVERELDYIQASRGLGNREITTLLRHLIPNVTGPMLAVAPIIASRAIVVEASLTFIGVGTQPPTSSWGLMIKDGQELFLVHPQLVIIPAIALSLLVVAINLVADGISDYVDPAQRVTIAVARKVA